MNVDSVLSLTRLAERGDVVIGNLAKLVLSLVEALRELERRAGLAELALEAERDKAARVKAALARATATGLSPDEVARLAEFVG